MSKNIICCRYDLPCSSEVPECMSKHCELLENLGVPKTLRLAICPSILLAIDFGAVWKKNGRWYYFHKQKNMSSLRPLKLFGMVTCFFAWFQPRQPSLPPGLLPGFGPIRLTIVKTPCLKPWFMLVIWITTIPQDGERHGYFWYYHPTQKGAGGNVSFLQNVEQFPRGRNCCATFWVFHRHCHGFSYYSPPTYPGKHHHCLVGWSYHHAVLLIWTSSQKKT